MTRSVQARLRGSREWMKMVLLRSPSLLITGALSFGILAATSQGRPAAYPAWDIASDTWVATDALGRSLPGATATGPPRSRRMVGIFYFLWLGQHGEAGPFDISRILATDAGAITDAQNSLWGPLFVPHHWGQPLFGYYVSDDEAVLRKHAQLLADAGIDFVIGFVRSITRRPVRAALSPYAGPMPRFVVPILFLPLSVSR